MNYFAIGAGSALIVLAIVGLTKDGGGLKFSRPTAIVVGAAGLFFLILGASPGFEF